MQHAIANEAIAVAHHDPDLANLLRQRHGGGLDLIRGFFAAHNFQQLHHVGGAEEVQANHVLRTFRCRRNVINTEGGGVGRQNRTRFAGVVQLTENLSLQFHAFKHRLDHQIHIAEIVIGQGAADQAHALLNLGLGDTAFLRGVLVVSANHCQTLVQRLLLDLGDGHGYPGVGEVHGNAATHGACTYNTHFMDVTNRCFLGKTFHFGDFPLGKEGMNQARTLWGLHALHKQFTLTLHTVFKGQAEGGFHRIHALERGKLAPSFLLQASAELFKHLATLVGLKLIGQIPYATNWLSFIGNVLCVGQANGLDVIAIFNRINNAQGQSVFSANKLTGSDHFQGFLRTRQTWQALSAPGSGQQAQLYFRQSHLGAAQGHPVMATQSGFQATAQRSAMNCRNNWLVAVLILVNNGRQPRILHGLAELANVGPGNKSAAFAHQQQYLGVGVFLALLQCSHQAGTNRMAEGVHRRIIHGDHADGAFPVISHDLRHNISSPYMECSFNKRNIVTI